jgi:hypothetical protein
MNDDLWATASEDCEGLARQAALARADAELESVMPFLLASRSPDEFEHRAALAGEPLTVIAARNDLYLGDLVTIARRRYELYREALMEGTDPVTQLEPLLNGGGYGQGPERPDSHTEGPDFSGGYSEVPAGVPGGPDPQVTVPRQEAAGPVSQATGSLRRRADASEGSMMTMPYTPPDLGTGNGSVDIGTPAPATGGMTPSIPAGMPGGSVAPVGDQQQVTSSRDPVRSRVQRATAMIAEANPGLPAAECERLGRRVVARYLREADLTDSVMSNGPSSGSSGDGGSSGGGGGGGTGLAGHMLEGQGLRSMIPGLGGGGGAAAAGEGAAAGAELAELAPLALAL